MSTPEIALTKEEENLYLKYLTEYDEIMNNQDMLDTVSCKSPNKSLPTNEEEVIIRGRDIAESVEYNNMVRCAFNLIRE